MKLTIGAIVSTIAAIILFAGYSGNYGVMLTHSSSYAPNYVFIGAQSFHGSVFLFQDVVQMRPAPAPISTPIGWRVTWIGHRQTVQLKYAIWYVRIGSSHGKTSGRVHTLHSLIFPIWCPLLISMIAALKWIKRGRKQPTAGFAVIHRN